ncbi:hypothetical protein JL49_13400 [Pseudoalteromonas luteoviolacea]|nr:hypothetical protein JL49_13400 [Pseudoalteromonas luteoviolacea]
MTQKARLKEIITGHEYWTLEEICNASETIFHKKDTPAAMSARWREIVAGPNLQKLKRVRKGTKNLWEYRIQAEPANDD